MAPGDPHGCEEVFHHVLSFCLSLSIWNENLIWGDHLACVKSVVHTPEQHRNRQRKKKEKQTLLIILFIYSIPLSLFLLLPSVAKAQWQGETSILI